ncbi:MAG: SRPBCC family protein [Acidobacteriota bacterium]
MINETTKVTPQGVAEVLIERAFNAPCSLVFGAMTKPELLKHWYGPDGWEMIVCDIDLQVGGKWRFVSRRPDGKEIGQLGVYREIERPVRLVNTEAWEDWDAGETIVSATFKGGDAKTHFEAIILFPSREVRDAVLKSGLDHGVEASYRKLSRVLESLAEQN